MRFIDINNEYLMMHQRTPKVRDPLAFWPSEASAIVNGELWGKCHRQIFWKVKGVPFTNKTDLLMIRKGLIGKAFEQSEIEVMRESGEYSEVMANYKIKVNITPEILISGELDTLAKKEKGEKYRILEFKSGGGRYWRDDVFGNQYKTGWPKDYYLLQVMLYLDMVKRYDPLKEFDITEAEISCLDREKCMTGSHLITLQDGYPVINGDLFPKLNIKDIYDRFKKLYYDIKTDNLPFGEFQSYIAPFEMKQLYRKKKVTKWAYDNAMTLGYGCHISCSFCNYIHRCQHTNGHREEFTEL